MPTRVVNGAQIHYEETGSGPDATFEGRDSARI